jgi:hypothetical protein
MLTLASSLVLFLRALRPWRGAFLYLMLTACSSGPVIHDVNQSYNQIRQTLITNLPNGLRGESPNGRELTSGFFTAGVLENAVFLDEDKAMTVAERAYAKVIILGERRPYQIEIRVYRQKRDAKRRRYSSPSIDKKASQDLARHFNAALANRREDMNVIDDFRAF